MENATKPPRLKETQNYDIQLIIFGFSSCLGALVAEKTLIGVDSVLMYKKLNFAFTCMKSWSPEWSQLVFFTCTFAFCCINSEKTVNNRDRYQHRNY